MSSDYEKARAANIKRNEDFLKDIGLTDLKQDIRATTTRTAAVGAERDKPISRKRQRVRQESAREGDGEHTETTQRRSRRLQVSTRSSNGEKEEEPSLLYLKDEREVGVVPKQSWRRLQQEKEEEGGLRRLEPQLLLDHIQAASQEHFARADNAGVVLCCDRINSMSVARLAQRLRSVKRTDKLILFYYGLQLAGLPALAEGARQILAGQHGVVIPPPRPLP